MMENENILSEIDLKLVKEAYHIIDIACDHYTNSPLLWDIWHKLYDLLEQNNVDV